MISVYIIIKSFFDELLFRGNANIMYRRQKVMGAMREIVHFDFFFNQ